MTQVWIPVPPDCLTSYEQEIEDWLNENVGSRYVSSHDKGKWCRGPYVNADNGDLIRIYYIRDADKVMATKLRWL